MYVFKLEWIVLLVVFDRCRFLCYLLAWDSPFIGDCVAVSLPCDGLGLN